ERALALFAPAAAVQHFTRSIQAERELGLDISEKSLFGRARAYDLAGDFEAARTDFEALLEEARRARDVRIEWQTLLDLGLLWASRDYERTGGYYERALTLARSQNVPEMIAHSLNRVGNW